MQNVYIIWSSSSIYFTLHSSNTERCKYFLWYKCLRLCIFILKFIVDWFRFAEWHTRQQAMFEILCANISSRQRARYSKGLWALAGHVYLRQVKQCFPSEPIPSSSHSLSLFLCVSLQMMFLHTLKQSRYRVSCTWKGTGWFWPVWPKGAGLWNLNGFTTIPRSHASHWSTGQWVFSFLFKNNWFALQQGYLFIFFFFVNMQSFFTLCMACCDVSKLDR